MAQRTWKDVARLILASYINAVPTDVVWSLRNRAFDNERTLVSEVATMYKWLLRPDRAAEWAARVNMLQMLTACIPLFMLCLVGIWWVGTPGLCMAQQSNTR